MSYYDDIYKMQVSILSTGRDDRGNYIVFNETIFYPQGGGQACDKGTITIDGTTLEITHVAKISSEIRHYTNAQPKEGQTAEIAIDQELRLFNSKLHSGGT